MMRDRGLGDDASEELNEKELASVLLNVFFFRRLLKVKGRIACGVQGVLQVFALCSLREIVLERELQGTASSFVHII